MRGIKLRAWTAKDRNWLATMWRHLPAAEIAARLGRTVGAVHHAAGRWGFRRPQKRLADYAEQIRALRAEGRGGTAIARRLGLCPRSVHAWLRRHEE